MAAGLSSLDWRMFVAPGLVFLFYLACWLRMGREPEPSALVTQYEPPAGLSPAGVRYVASGTCDGRSLAAVIAQLAVRGCLRAEPSDGGKYKLSRLMSDRATEASLAPEERRTLELLFEDGPVFEVVPGMDEATSARNGRYVYHIHDELAGQLRGKYSTRNAGAIALGVAATFVSALAMAVASTARIDQTMGALFITLWVLFIGLLIGMMVEMQFLSASRSAFRARVGLLKLLPGLAAFAVFGGVIVFMLRDVAKAASPSFALMLVAFLAVNLGWAPFLKRKTQAGRAVCDQIAGFRAFLAKAEQDRLNRLNPAQEMPRELDPFLAYAIALEVKESWGDHLAEAFFASTVFAGE